MPSAPLTTWLSGFRCVWKSALPGHGVRTALEEVSVYGTRFIQHTVLTPNRCGNNTAVYRCQRQCETHAHKSRPRLQTGSRGPEGWAEVHSGECVAQADT